MYYILLVYYIVLSYEKMRRALSLCLLAVFPFALHAQISTIAESPSFEEPSGGLARILQLKNGNTLYVHFPSRGVNIQLYDSSHQRVDTIAGESTFAHIRNGNLDAVFESQGNATVLYSVKESKHPLLVRLTIDAGTGQLLREDTVANLDKVNRRKKKISSSDFLVIKDPYSENYAVSMYANMEEADAGYEIVHYAADHHEISRARFTGPDNETRFQYWDMVVIGDKQLCILGMAQNAANEVASSEMKLATLEKGHIFFRFSSLSFPKGVAVQGGFVKYNPYTDQLILLEAHQKEDKKMTTWLTTVQLSTMEAAAAKEIFPDKANLKSLEVFGPKAPYEGVPQNVFIKKDGGYSVVFEELDNFVRLVNSVPVVISTILSNVAVIDMDAEGKEINTWMVPKRQLNPGLIMKAFYQKNRENATDKIDLSDQYKFFSYVPGAKHDYILMNDLEENKEKLEKGKLTVMRDAREGNGFYYALEGKEIIPARNVVFPVDVEKKQRHIALFSMADYDIDRNTLVTLKRSQESRRDVKLVWLNVH